MWVCVLYWGCICRLHFFKLALGMMRVSKRLRLAHLKNRRDVGVCLVSYVYL